MPKPRDSIAKGLSMILPAIILILVGLFAVTVIRDYGRASEADRRALLEKGDVLIRALESGSRVGMGMGMHHGQQQALLEEMAAQPGVLWFAITDAQGISVLHSDPRQVGTQLYPAQQMQRLRSAEETRSRLIENAGQRPVMEIYRRFRPTSASWQHGMHGGTRDVQSAPPSEQTIFIAVDASDYVATREGEGRNTLIILFALATVLLATILSCFWYRRYLRSRQLLHDEMKREEKLLALGHLAAGVAHEIRNPLSSIKGLAKYFAERMPAGGEAHQLAQVMAKEADRLNRVVSELLELVKPAHLAIRAVDLNALIIHSLQLISQDALGRHIALQFNANDTLPAVQADPDRLTQVLLNLYLNAIQAIDRDGVIRVAVNEMSSGVSINVTDTGKGIEPEQLETIFTPYFTTKADGTGLGLAMVLNIIEHHRGTVRVSSVVDKGTTFTLWLPLHIKRKE